MDHDLEKYTKVTFKWKDKNFKLMDVQLQCTETVKELRILVSSNLFLKAHVEETLMKAIKELHFRKIVIDAQNEDQT